VSTAQSTGRISDADVAGVIELIKGSDSVELKLTVPEHGHRSAISALELDPLEAQIRQVFFFDTPELALNQAGVVVRARRVQKKGDDSVVKLRPVVPAEMPSALRQSPEFVVELDAMPGGYVCSGSLKGSPTADIRQTITGGKRPSSLFSKSQKAFYAEHAPDGIALDDLSVLGPIFVLKLKAAPTDFARRLVVEMWLYPDGSRILELSTKCLPSEAFQTAAEARGFLAQRGIDVSGEQETKTKKALQFFSRELAKAAGSEKGA
jgi:hypothetical protein